MTPNFCPVCALFPAVKAFSQQRSPLTIYLLIIRQDAALCCHWLVL